MEAKPGQSGVDAFARHEEHKQSENRARNESLISALNATPSHQQFAAAAPQKKSPPQAAHSFCAGPLPIDSRFGKPALMFDRFSWKRA
jgi:hypothetical protein